MRPHTLPNIIITKRLTVRPLTLDDAQFIVSLLNQPSFIENIGDKQVRNIEDSQKYLQQGPLSSYQTHGFGLCCVQLKDTEQPIGMCGILKRSELEQPDLGYALLPDFTGQGFAFEAAQAVLKKHFEQFSLNQVLAVTKPDNLPSRRLLERLGFEQEGELELYGIKNCLYGFRG